MDAGLVGAIPGGHDREIAKVLPQQNPVGHALQQRAPVRQQVPVFRQVAIIADLVEQCIRFQGRSALHVVYRFVGEKRESQVGDLVAQVAP